MAKKQSELSRHAKLVKKKKQHISNTKNNEKERKSLKKMSDKDLDYTDIPELDFKQLGEPMQGHFYRPLKKQISIRLDMDVLDWFQHANKKYQSLINQVCREYMERNKK